MTVAEAYKADGVNLSAGDAFSSYAGRAARSTWNNSRFVKVKDLSAGHFRGPRAYRLTGLRRGYYETLGADGVGTKTCFHVASLLLEDAGYDMLAMTFGDITRGGGMPLLSANVLDVSSLGEVDSEEFKCFKSVVDGLISAANASNGVVINGETAELGPCVGSENPHAKVKFNWASVAAGVYHPDRMITGDDVRPGHKVVALREKSFRSNGMSMARAAFRLKFGTEWWDVPEAMPYIRQAAMRSTLYDLFLARANGWYGHKRIPVSLIAHITGGGIPEKLGSLLFPRGFSAILDDLYDPPQIMLDCAAWRELDGKTTISDETFLRTWNGGQGVLAVMPEEAVEDFVELARACGHEAKVCGCIHEADTPELVIHSKWRGKQAIIRA